MDRIEHILGIVGAVLFLLGFFWLKWKHIKQIYSRDDLLKKSQIATLFDTERKRL